MRKQKGMALLMTLVFLQICALLSLYALQASWLATRLSRYAWHQHQFANRVEQILEQAEQEMQSQQPLCMVPVGSAGQFKGKPISWWEEKSCVGNFMTIHYYYVVELLGKNDCAEVGQNKDSVAAYYRLTLLGLDNSGLKALMQSITIKKADTKPSQCNGVKFQVNAGRQELLLL